MATTNRPEVSCCGSCHISTVAFSAYFNNPPLIFFSLCWITISVTVLSSWAMTLYVHPGTVPPRMMCKSISPAVRLWTGGKLPNVMETVRWLSPCTHSSRPAQESLHMAEPLSDRLWKLVDRLYAVAVLWQCILSACSSPNDHWLDGMCVALFY